MPRIFISYRRADSRKDAGRLYDRLTLAFGKANVFKDVDNIPPGMDFRGVLSEAVSSCDVVLVIIGQQWLNARDEHGNRRLDSPDDYVRIEIETGLVRNRAVTIPILVDGAMMPKPEELPHSLRELSYKNAVIVRDDPDFNRDVARLVDWLSSDFQHVVPRPTETQKLSQPHVPADAAVSAQEPPPPAVAPQLQQRSQNPRPAPAHRASSGHSRRLVFAAGGLVLLLAITVIMLLQARGRNNGGGDSQIGQNTATSTNLVAAIDVTSASNTPGLTETSVPSHAPTLSSTPTPSDTPSPTETPTVTPTPSWTPTPTQTPTPIPTLSETEIQATIQQETELILQENNATETMEAEETHKAATATATWWTPTATINFRASAAAVVTERANATATRAMQLTAIYINEQTSTYAALGLTETAALWTPTPSSTPTPTITPSHTNTPPPTDTLTPLATPTRTPSPTSTPTRRAVPTLTPRASATTRPTATPQAVRLGAAGGERIVRPERNGTLNLNDGSVIHNDQNVVQGGAGAETSVRDFVTEITFHTPYTATEDQAWDMGIYFRYSNSVGMRLGIHSSGYWILQSLGETGETVHEGNINDLNIAANGSNRVKLIAVGNYGALFVNDDLLAHLNLSASMNAGDIIPVIGVFKGSKINGERSRYSNWSIKSPEPLNSPQQGELRHDGDNFIEQFEIRGANNAAIKRRDFIVEVSFDTPFITTDDQVWDFGLMIRNTGANQNLRLTFTSRGNWRLGNFVGIAEVDGDWIVNRTTSLLNIATGSENNLLLIATGKQGLLFLNNTFLAELDLSKRMDSGSILIGTEFYANTGKAGSVTRFSDFRVWALGSG